MNSSYNNGADDDSTNPSNSNTATKANVKAVVLQSQLSIREEESEQINV